AGAVCDYLRNVAADLRFARERLVLDGSADDDLAVRLHDHAAGLFQRARHGGVDLGDAAGAERGVTHPVRVEAGYREEVVAPLGDEAGGDDLVVGVEGDAPEPV